MTLCEGKVNTRYIVESMKLTRATNMRLESLGLTIGTPITVLNSKKSGSIIFHVRGTRLAIGKAIAEAIFVRELIVPTDES